MWLDDDGFMANRLATQPLSLDHRPQRVSGIRRRATRGVVGSRFRALGLERIHTDMEFRMKMKRSGLLRSSMLAGLAAIGLAAAPGYAQDAEEEEAEEQDVITVTGSLIRRSEFSSTAPIQVVTAEIATLEGLVDTAEMLQTASVAAGSFQLNNQFGGFVVQGGTGVNSISLRGLGAGRTLVLLNGNRPGPAGTRGEVGAFDLNVIPASIIQRSEILKDGASSVYGSDAVAGVVNVITRDRVDAPELTVAASLPEDGGGETYTINGAYGLNFDRGSVVLAAEYQLREDLSVGDRDYLSCSEPYFFDSEGGNRIDRQDQSILAGTDLAGCSNIYFNTAIDAFSGLRYIPDPTSTAGPIPGYRPRENCRYEYTNPADRPVWCPVGAPASYEDVLNSPLYASTDAINRQERFSFYAKSDFDLDFLGGVNWQNEFLFNRRETTSEGWRQFFPLIGGATVNSIIGVYGYANDPTYDGALLLSQPVTIWPSNGNVSVDYYSLTSSLEGEFSEWFGPIGDWAWAASATISRSSGDYGRNSILASESGDARFDDDAPIYDPFSAEFLSGNYGDAVYDQLTRNTLGNTVYEQLTVNAVMTGELIDLPAGPLGAAFGVEYREFSIDDQPDAAAQAGDLWGESSALVTQGEDSVTEIFAEVEIPLLNGMTFVEDLSINLSGRAFDYESAGSGDVWKAGFNWQVTPTFRVRGTKGTSYRAPALFELFLGNQTAFGSQLSIDPCIDWGNSTNENTRANCAAVGIPDDFAGGSSSATIISGGGAGFLEPETSTASTLGVIWTPESIALSVAIDYFDIEVNNQISQLGAGSIVSNCYSREDFPNVFCSLFTRNPGTDPVSPWAIGEVLDSYININSQISSGVDFTVRYEHEFSFGDMTVEAQATKTNEDIILLFGQGVNSGLATDDFNGTIGDPEWVGNARVSLNRGDFTYSWFMDYVGATSQDIVGTLPDTTYQGIPAWRDVVADERIYHDASVRWQGDGLGILVGVSNILAEDPPFISSGVATRRGNIPAFGTQYDLRGRTGFVRVTKTF